MWEVSRSRQALERGQRMNTRGCAMHTDQRCIALLDLCSIERLLVERRRGSHTWARIGTRVCKPRAGQALHFEKQICPGSS